MRINLYDHQPFPDDRELPEEFINPQVLFDEPYRPELPQRERLAEDAFRRQIDRFELLNPEQAQQLAASIQSGKEAAEVVAGLGGGREAPNELLEAVEAGEQARLELFTKNLRLATWIARMSMNLPNQSKGASDDPLSRVYPGAIRGNLATYAGMPMPLADRMQAASIGLWKAAGKHKGDKGKFSTYAMYHIEQEMVRSIHDYGETSGARYPLEVGETDLKIRRAEADHEAAGDHPSDSIIAQDLVMVPDEVAKLRKLRYWHQADSLEMVDDEMRQSLIEGTDDETLVLADIVADPDESVEDRVMEEALTDTVHAVLDDSTLTEDEARLVRLRFGLHGEEPMTLKAIGQVFGITAERVRQKEATIMSKLRGPRVSAVLRPFWEEDYEPPVHRRRAQPPVQPEAAAADEAAGVRQRRLYREMLERERTARREALEAAREQEEQVVQLFYHTPVDMYRQEPLRETYRSHDHLIDHLRKGLPAGLPAQQLERFWNTGMPDLVQQVGEAVFDHGRFNAAFSRLIDATIEDDETVRLRVPKWCQEDMDRMASGITKGTVVIEGNVGNRLAENLGGTARVVVRGNAGHMAGVRMHGQASLVVEGSAGTNAGFGMSDEAYLYIGGDTGSGLGRAATSGTIEVQGRVRGLGTDREFAGVLKLAEDLGPGE